MALILGLCARSDPLATEDPLDTEHVQFYCERYGPRFTTTVNKTHPGFQGAADEAVEANVTHLYQVRPEHSRDCNPSDSISCILGRESWAASCLPLSHPLCPDSRLALHQNSLGTLFLSSRENAILQVSQDERDDTQAGHTGVGHLFDSRDVLTKHGLHSDMMALITSDCAAVQSKRP